MFPEPTALDRALRIAVIVVVVLALAAIIIGGIWIWKSRYDAGVVTTYVTKENARVGGDIAVANETMAAEKTADVVRVVTQREELRSAQIDRPDGLTARQRRGCVILRQQGQDLAGDPTCRRLAR